jgi:hypothetical protein
VDRVQTTSISTVIALMALQKPFRTDQGYFLFYFMLMSMRTRPHLIHCLLLFLVLLSAFQMKYSIINFD